ncbi:MAG: DinB family protein [Bacteroidota bacterium]
MTGRPAASEYAPYFGRYIDLVPGDDLLGALRLGAGTAALLRSADPEAAAYAYAPGKWTLAQSLQHVIDTERIFGARALRIARGDTTPLPGFDQDAFAEDTPNRSLADLADEFEAVRASTLALFASLGPEAAARMGTSSGGPLSARAAGWIIAGHEWHHDVVTRERYLAR